MSELLGLQRTKPIEPEALINTTTLKMDDRIKAEVVTQYTTTDERTYTDALAAARHQVCLDLCDLYEDPIAAPMDLSDWCFTNADRLRVIVQRLADIQAATPVPPAPLPRPVRKR